MLGKWLGRTVGIGIFAAVVAACGNSGSGDDTSAPGTDGGGGKTDAGDAGDGDASMNNEHTGDGGVCISNCHEGTTCTDPTQCASGMCTAGVCADPSCMDGTKDGTETAPDCGGICSSCADGLACIVGGDCESGVCNATTKTCAVPTSTDGVKNGSETDVDCGDTGRGEDDHAPPCGDGKMCKMASDCANMECSTNGDCTPASCSDGKKNGTETALDCGGLCNPCADGLGCAVDTDCSSKSCDVSGTKLCLAPTDMDNIPNGNETDTDCGSGGTNDGGENTHAPACADGKKCVSGADCLDLVCDPTAKTCSTPTCSDGQTNGGETGTDCGNQAITTCKACGDGLGCTANSDCTSLHCDTTGTHLCLKPTSSDKIANGNESDVDCGSSGSGEADSPAAPKCPDINTHTTAVSLCGAPADCLSGFCDTTRKRCVDGQSCALPAATKASIIQDISVQATATADAQGTANANGAGLLAGIDTCGKGEATDSAALTAHDSCCKSLDINVPAEAKTIRMDKYEVTSGRMRQFIEAVSAEEGGTYNIAAWVAHEISTNTTAGKTMAALFPTGSGGTTNTPTLFPPALGGALGLAYQVGTSMDNGTPSSEQGCFMGTSQYAAATYWFDKSDGTNVDAPPRAFTQDYYDIKSMNCTPYWMAAAFCAWDGGSLPTKAEFDHLWGTGNTYPWGAGSRRYADIGAPPDGTLITNWTVDNENDDSGASLKYFYQYPAANGDTAGNPSNPGTGPLSYMSILDETTGGFDNTPWIAAPGRFTRDVTLLAATGEYAGDLWYDVAANMMEYESITNLAANQTAPVSGFCDTSQGITSGDCTGYSCTHDGKCGTLRGGNMPPVAWNGGSWEVHDIQQDGYNEPMQTQYGKAGFRCMRPTE